MMTKKELEKHGQVINEWEDRLRRHVQKMSNRELLTYFMLFGNEENVTADNVREMLLSTIYMGGEDEYKELGESFQALDKELQHPQPDVQEWVKHLLAQEEA